MTWPQKPQSLRSTILLSLEAWVESLFALIFVDFHACQNKSLKSNSMPA